MRPRYAAFILAALALTMAGCASEPAPDTTSTQTTPPQMVVYATMEGFRPHFYPDNVTVRVGESVLFRVADGQHTVDFDPAEGISNQHSGPLSAQMPFAVRFQRAGTFHYHCENHDGMTGSVTAVP